jgi:hypothetical protein
MSKLILISFLYSNSTWARSLKATADKLGADMMALGIAVSTFAIIVAGIWVMLGKQDGGAKFTQALSGLLVIFCVPAIIGFVRGLV